MFFSRFKNSLSSKPRVIELPLNDGEFVCYFAMLRAQVRPSSAPCLLWRWRWSAAARHYASSHYRGGELRVFVVAGEPSGDVLGARLMAALKSVCPTNIKFAGVGGVLMERQGLKSEFPMDDLTVMGLWELIPQLVTLRARLHQTVSAAMKFQPHVVVAIDSKGFCFRLFKYLKGKCIQSQQTCPLNVLYVAPSAWAWKRPEEKLKKWVGVVDHILCILPFEEPLCKANGLAATFVGHPVLEDAFHDTVKADLWTSNWHITGCREKFLAKHGLSPGTTLLSLLPGSRMQEVSRMLPIYGEALKVVNDGGVNLTAVIPTVLNQDLTRRVEAVVSKWEVPVILLPEASLKEKYDAFAASSVGLCTSGTVVLQMMLARLPCVVAFRANIMTEWIIKRSIQLKYMSVPNILLDSPIIPEAGLSECTANRLAELLRILLQEKEMQEKQILTAAKVLSMLMPTTQNPPPGDGSEAKTPSRPSILAAQLILNLLRAS